MPHAKLREHLQSVSERLDAVTAELLSEAPGIQQSLLAERRSLLADVVRTSKKLERPAVKSLVGTVIHAPQDMKLVRSNDV